MPLPNRPLMAEQATPRKRSARYVVENRDAAGDSHFLTL
jgi:hypothetical protein